MRVHACMHVESKMRKAKGKVWMKGTKKLKTKKKKKKKKKKKNALALHSVGVGAACVRHIKSLSHR
jgi:hypothetical protein